MKLGIAVMTRAPSDPNGKTRLRQDRAFATALQTAMLADTLTGLDAHDAVARTVFVAPAPGALAEVERALPRGWTAQLQRGATLGERLVDAIRAMLQVADRVLVTGSDAPFVGASLDTLGTIAEDEVVIVPSADGGYAAIGLGRLERTLFDDMPWSTDRVFAETCTRARAGGLVVRALAPTYDVDEPSDLARLREDLAGAPSRAPRTAALLAR